MTATPTLRKVAKLDDFTALADGILVRTGGILGRLPTDTYALATDLATQVVRIDGLENEVESNYATLVIVYSQGLQTEQDARIAADKAYSLQPVVSNRGLSQSINADVTQAFPNLGIPLTIPTGYPGNDVVEPSILYDDAGSFFADVNGRNGYKYVMCIGGYSGSNALYENPNQWVSNDGFNWIYVVYGGGIGTPTPGYGGFLTPIVPNGVQGDGNLSDPYIVRGPDGWFYILWNQFLNATPGGTGTGGNTWSIKGIKSQSIAGPWSAPVTLVAQLMSARRDSSPTALWDGSKWHIYTVDLKSVAVQPPIGHYTVSNVDLFSAWAVQPNPPIAMPVAYNTRGWWHLNAYRWGTKQILVIQDNVVNTSGAGNLWLVSSDDGGVTWTVPSDPFMKGSFYRSAFVIGQHGDNVGFDHFYGTLNTNWGISRNFVGIGQKTNSGTYGGLRGGVPVHPSAVNSARVPLAPFLAGDAAIRADSAITPGNTDSGQAYSVTSGTVGIVAHALYGVAATNNRAAFALAGAADGVYACRFKVVDTTVQNYFIVRYKDASNYVRIGHLVQTLWTIQNIVGGVSSQAFTFASGPAPTNADVVALLCIGSTITVFINGIAIGQVTGWVSNQAESGMGVQFANISNCRMTDLYMRSLVGGV